MVWRCISSCWFSVLIKGTPYGFFEVLRGFAARKPLSPGLFVLGAEVLSRALNSLEFMPRFTPYRTTRTSPFISHLAYADDVLIFSAGDRFFLSKLTRDTTWIAQTQGRWYGIPVKTIDKQLTANQIVSKTILMSGLTMPL